METDRSVKITAIAAGVAILLTVVVMLVMRSMNPPAQAGPVEAPGGVAATTTAPDGTVVPVDALAQPADPSVLRDIPNSTPQMPGGASAPGAAPQMPGGAAAPVGGT